MTHTFDKGFDIDTNDEFSIGDYQLNIPLSADLILSVGKQKELISMRRLMGLAYLPMQERAAFIDALLPSRNHEHGGFSETEASYNVSWAVGAFNKWIDHGESFNDTSSQLVDAPPGHPRFFRHERNLSCPYTFLLAEYAWQDFYPL